MVHALTFTILTISSLRSVLGISYSPGTIVALRLSNGGATLSADNGNAVFLDEVTTAGVRLQTIPGPSSCTIDGAPRASGYAYEGRVSSSADGQVISYVCFGVSLGTPVATALRQIVSTDVSGSITPPLSTGLSNVGAFAAMRVSAVASSGFYHGGTGGLYYTPPGGGSSVLLNSADAQAMQIFRNSLCESLGCARI
jgi:hypothetical protein